MNAIYSAYLRELSEPAPAGDYTKTAIDRAAKAAGLHYWRAFDIWYCKARRIDAHEAAQITEALDKKREEEARNEIQDLRTRLLKMESRFTAEAADSNRSRISRHRSSISGRGCLDSAVGRGK